MTTVSKEEKDAKDEEDRIHNRKIAREGSWIHALFEDAGLNQKDKKEIFKRVMKDFSNQEVQNAKATACKG